MADVKENALTTKSPVVAGDKLRGIGVSDSASYNMLVQDVAKYIIETYAGSSVAGSAQSVKAALDALNSKYKHNTKTVTSNASGNIELGIPANATFVTATAPSSVYMILPFKAGNTWYGKVVGRIGVTLEVAINTEVTVQSDYI